MNRESYQELPPVNPEDVQGIPFAWEIEQEQNRRLVGIYDPFDSDDCALYEVACRNLRDVNHRAFFTEVIRDGEGYVAAGLFIADKKQSH